LSDITKYFCAGQTEQIEFAHPLGVGLVESAINLTRFFMQNSCDEALFLGSCGSYGDRDIFEIIESDSASNIELSLLLGESYTPISNQIKTSLNVPRGTINSSNYITSSKKNAELYLAKGLDGENMEFFSFLKVAERFGVKAKGIFVVTNYCYEDAKKEYAKNYKKALSYLIEYVESRSAKGSVL